MKKNVLTAFIFSIYSIISFAQPLFKSNFNAMTANIDISGQDGWTNNSSTYGCGLCVGIGCINSDVVAKNMSYPNYSTDSLAVRISDNQDCFGHAFSSVITSGSFYFSFIINVDSADATPQDFMRFLSEGAFNTMLRVRTNSGGASSFYLSLADNGGLFGTNNTSGLAFNTNHLIVIKYEFISGPANNIVSVFINPNVLLAPPVPALSFVCSSEGFGSIDRFGVRTNASSGIPGAWLGGFVVDTVWNNLATPSMIGELVQAYSISPNPCNDQLNIKSNHAEFVYSLYSTLGAEVLKGRAYQSNVSIEVSSLAKGIYLLSLTDAKDNPLGVKKISIN